MDRKSRDALIVQRYEAGDTLEAIGRDLGLTRERVRQIVRQLGGASAEESRAQRALAKEAEERARSAALLSRFGPTAKTMARAGFTRARAIDRLTLLHPDVVAEHLDAALLAADIPFKKADFEDRFSDEALEAGVLCVMAGSLGLRPDREHAAVGLSDKMIADVVAALETADISTEDRADILGLIAAGRREADSGEGATITGEEYNALRESLVGTLGLVSMQGTSPWPPTKQTVAARFGSWNDALRGFGLATSSRGRARGLIVYTVDDYRSAATDFVTECRSSGAGQTYANYEDWARGELDAGRRRPSSASMRNYFGSWHDVVVAGRGLAGS